MKTAEKLNRQKLKQMADPPSFQRGEDYFESGRVRVLTEKPEMFSAKVRGSRDYRVKIQIREKEIQYSCNCPLGVEEVFCKHLVAAGLTWAEGFGFGDLSPRHRRFGRYRRLYGLPFHVGLLPEN